ncbi:MAG: hypothetical protein KGL39_59385, partial [Patescibacteria group bacterium]|nr:hypothetical protein [Patescibacteria group bacterium]
HWRHRASRNGHDCTGSIAMHRFHAILAAGLLFTAAAFAQSPYIGPAVKATLTGATFVGTTTNLGTIAGGAANPQAMQNTVFANALATGGNGSSSSPFTGWDAGVEGLPGHTHVHFPCGPSGTVWYYSYSSPLVLSSAANQKGGWTITGGGRGDNTSLNSCAYVEYTGTGDGIQIIYPINGTYGAFDDISGIALIGTNSSNTGAGVDDIDGSFVQLHDMTIVGFRYNVVFDQAEVSRIFNNSLEGSTATTNYANVWLVNGPQWSGAAGNLTNRISVDHNQFEGPATFAVADDGGANHDIVYNNMEDGSTAAIWQDDCATCTVASNETESNALGYMGTFEYAFGGSNAPNSGVAIKNNLFASSGPNALFFVDGSYNVQDNELECSSVCIFGDSNTSQSSFADNTTPGIHPIFNEGAGNNAMYIHTFTGFGFGTDDTTSAYFNVLNPFTPSTVSSGNGSAAVPFTFRNGPGGATTSASGATGGTGGGMSFTAGNGGSAPSGSTNGNGGDIDFVAGSPGSGAGSPGSAGQIALGGPVNYCVDDGANNAIACAAFATRLPPLVTGLTVTVQLAHTLQAGANTFAYAGGAAVAVKSSFNPANNIATAYASGGLITLEYNGSVWLDVKQ